jgi:hypothetical protein
MTIHERCPAVTTNNKALFVMTLRVGTPRVTTIYEEVLLVMNIRAAPPLVM